VKLLVTGAGGFVGSHLVEHVRRETPLASVHGVVHRARSRAVHVAISGRPGPVGIGLPEDMLTEATDDAP